MVSQLCVPTQERGNDREGFCSVQNGGVFLSVDALCLSTLPVLRTFQLICRYRLKNQAIFTRFFNKKAFKFEWIPAFAGMTSG